MRGASCPNSQHIRLVAPQSDAGGTVQPLRIGDNLRSANNQDTIQNFAGTNRLVQSQKEKGRTMKVRPLVFR
jgi:hypothetical protein